MMPTLSPSPSSTPTPPPPPPQNTWGPYSNSGDFRSNAIVILSAFFCAVVLLLALNSIVRFLFCTNDPGSAGPPQKPKPSDDGSAEAEKATSALVFSKEMGLAGGAAECAICLSEFVEGEGIRVLDVCKHWFHVQCVERWLKVRSSCPTCRSIICSSSSSSTGLVEEV